MYKEDRDVLQEEMRETDECDMEEFDTLDVWQRENDRYPRREMVATGGQTGRGQE